MPLELFTSETGIHACACGSEHLAIVSLDGEVYTWGRKGGGRLGLPDDKIMGGKVQTPTRVSSVSGIRIRDISCGNAQTVCVTERGQVIAWGKENGKLTCIEPVEQNTPYMRALPWKPFYVRMPLKVTSVSCGWEFTIALTQNAALIGWGENNKGQLGFPSTGPVTTPTLIKLPKMNEYEEDSDYVTAVECGSNHACCIDNNGRLYSWGDNQFGQCGQGHWDSIAEPEIVGGAIEGLKVHGVSCGQHTIAIAGPRKCLFSWGAGTRGQLGHGTETDVNTPKQIEAVNNLQFEKVHCGEYHSLGVTTGQLIYTWGSNIFGELTQGSKGSLKKVACYTTPHYRGKNLAKVPDSASFGPNSSNCRVKLGCGGVNTLIVRYQDKSQARGAAQSPRIVKSEVKVLGTPTFHFVENQSHSEERPQTFSADGVGAGAASGSGAGEGRSKSQQYPRSESTAAESYVENPFKISPETVFFPVPPQEECKSTQVLREIKKRRYRNALKLCRKARTDVRKRVLSKNEKLAASSFAGNSLETLFNEVALTPTESFDLEEASSLLNQNALKSVEKATDHIKNATLSIANAAVALESNEKEKQAMEEQFTATPMSQTEKREIIEVSREIKKYIERYHGKVVDIPATPRKGEDLEVYYEEVAYQAHAAASRILQQMQGMRMMYEDMDSAVSHMSSDNPDEKLIDYLLSFRSQSQTF